MVTTACTPDGRGAVQDRAHVVGARCAARVEVGVRVDQRCERLGQAAARVGLRHAVS